MPSPLDRLIDRCEMRCTVCNALAGTCDCWEKCSCGWSNRKGEFCRNPQYARCSSKLKYGRYNRRTRRYEPKDGKTDG